MSDTRISAASALRNRDPILDVLRGVLPAEGSVLEIASGTGEHVVYFAEAFPGLTFQPSDPAPERRASVDAWAAGIANILPAVPRDATQPWPERDLAAVLCINMIHIAPIEATFGLIANAAQSLGTGGCLFLYGPYRRGGEHTAPSNADFDADLRARNPQWGIRDLEDVTQLAAQAGFAAPEITEMPANNLAVVFRRA